VGQLAANPSQTARPEKGAMIVKPITEDQIRSRAYQIYLERGQQHQHAFDDWVQAEYELLQLPIQYITKLKSPRHKLSHLALVSIITAALLVGTLS
jgi:hypothetical protein